MRRIVLDASAAIEALVDARGLGNDVRQAIAECETHAPELIDVEVLSTMARLERAGTLSHASATTAIDFWDVVPVRLHAERDLMPQAWRTRGSVRISDGFYLALAFGMGAPLVTCDGRLARAPHPGVTVTLIA
ncbi:MAG: type II toxin-antitoxin system VapC family toxin [Propionibacteriaceae bacterium]|nr:type II toxin-antitoxin system VapC family toxin [Propionibacteriaceae bacterium]